MNVTLQSHRLFRVGVGLMLAAVLLGLAIPQFASPRVALSAHLIGLLQGMLLVVIGLLWPRLTLPAARRSLTCGLVLYQALAAFGANVLAAAWAAGGSIIPMAAGAAQGSSMQEAIVVVGLRTSGISLIVALVLMLTGLSGRPSAASTS